MIEGALLLVAVFIALVFLGVPVVYALGISAIGSLIFQWQLPTGSVNLRIANGVSAWSFLAVPFFMFAGELMTASGITDRLVRLMRALVGHVHGGLSHVLVVTEVILSGISGSAVADAAATGSVLVPAMKKAGYPPAYGAAIVAASAALGPIIPPSILMVLYGLIAEVSIGRLFLGGVVPGLIVAVFLLVAGYVVARKRNFPRDERIPFREVKGDFLAAIPALLIPIVIIGGMVRGLFDPTEASIIAVAAAFLVGFFFYREVRWRDLRAVMATTVRTSGSILLIAGIAIAFGSVVSLFQLGPKIGTAMQSLTTNPLVFLLMMNVLFFILGCLLDIAIIVLIFIPILIPAATSYGIDPVHFSLVSILNLMIGMITPPYGIMMMMMCRFANVTVTEFWREVWPFFFALLAALFVITVWPASVLWLPDLLMGRSP